MPTNLPAEYYQVEERYKAAQSPQERIRLLEELISTVPKHKGTDHLRADLRRKLSKMKEAAEQGPRGGAARHVSAYHVEREGAGQVVLVGPPNTGKSALVEALTTAAPEVAAHPYTTWGPTPGMLNFHHVQIQLVDLPPLNPDYVDHEMMDLIRRADLLLLVVDMQGLTLEQIDASLELLAAQGIVPAWREDVGQERGIYRKRVLIVVNKCDDETLEEDFAVLHELLGGDWPLVAVSATHGRHFEALGQAIFDQLALIRVFSQPPGRDADLTAPFVLPRGSTVADFAAKVHKDFLEQLKSARVWGSGAFDGQAISRDHVLADGDIVELRL